jgi:UDP-2,3-diacylglucosamine pyrophosphatase LpxH
MPPPFSLIGLAIFVAAILAISGNFRFLLYPLIPSLNPVSHASRLRLKGNTLFISDLHLEWDRPFKYSQDLSRFIQANSVTNLVIDGDLFDSPWDAQEMLKSDPKNNVFNLFSSEGSGVNLFWVTGSPSHDPSKPSENMAWPNGLHVLGRCALIDLGDFEVLVYHGHDLSLKGAIGHAWNRFVSKLGLERAWRRLARIDPGVWVVFGHTHIPGVDTRNRVANCGGWQKAPFVSPTRTGILLAEHEDAPKLVQLA